MAVLGAFAPRSLSGADLGSIAFQLPDLGRPAPAMPAGLNLASTWA